MGVKVHIHKTHRSFTDGKDVVEVEGRNVGDCLGQVVRQYPKLKEALYDRKGRLLNVIEIYVNKESAYPEELAKKVNDGDEIHVTMMLAGG